MKKFFAAIGAFLLAVLMAVGVGLFKGVSVKEKVRSWIQAGSPPPSVSVSVSLPQEDAGSLNYDERLEKGNYFFDRGFYTLALGEYAKAAVLKPNQADPYLKLFRTYFQLGDFEKARSNAQTALTLDSNILEAQWGLIHLALKQNAFEEANRLITPLLSVSPVLPRTRYYQGLLMIATGQSADAEAIFKQAKTEASDADLLSSLDALLSAYAEFSFTQAGEPLYRDELLARSFNQIHEYELAIAKLKDVLKTRPDLRDAWILLGFAYLNLGRHYFALTAFQQAYDLDVTWPTTPYFMALTYAELGDPQQAIIHFNYALKNGFQPASVIQRKLAELYLENQRYDEAVALYRVILEESGSDVSAFVRPVWLYLDYLHDPTEALKLAEKAVSLFPDSALAYNLLGWSQMEGGLNGEAQKNLEKALSLYPDLAAAHYNLGRLQERLGKTKDALEAYKKAFDLDRDGSIGRMAGQRYNDLLSPQP